MDTRRLRDLLQSDPFRPFRLVSESGKTYDILEPTQISISQREIAVAIPGKGGRPAEQMVFLPLDESSIQPIAFA
jgi:hypothetical protein